jgi:hypothetical protein
MTEAAAKAIIDQKADDALSGAQLRRELLFEVMRLRSLGRKYYERAMASDGETNSGLLFVKASERLATLLGMNAVQGHALTIIHEQAPERQLTSTDKIRAAIDRIRGKSLPKPESGDPDKLS